MDALYEGTYQDEYGEEAIAIRSDGKDLWTTIRGVEFTSQNLYEFEELVPDSATAFSLKSYSATPEIRILTGYRMEVDIPVTVVTNLGEEEGIVHVTVTGNDKDPQSEVRVRDMTFPNPIPDFEGLYEHLKMPAGWYLKACITCAYSDYNPVGNDSFGGMLCFRNAKAAYRQVDSKHALFDLMRPRQHESVQETWWCPDYEHRIPGSGYRG